MKNIIRHNDFQVQENFGGKANSLLNLVKNGIPVPKFFIITSSVFEKFLEYNNISVENFEQVRMQIGEGTFHEKLANEIYDLWKEYEFSRVSVRSSASNEDGIKKSFAGQYETYLDVSKENLLEKIKGCWESLYDENVISYNGNCKNCSMNVIVQEMIDADYSGVAFSLDPTNSSQNYSIIEVTKGLGEKLVSGLVTPTRLIVRRQTGKSDLTIGENFLDDETIEKLETIVLDIEKIYGLPVDIEWCILKNEIYILQTRPITAFNITPKTFEKSISREKSLIEIEIYYRGEYEGIKTLTRGLYYFNPLFIYDNEKKIVDIYYNTFDLEEYPASMFYYMKLGFEKTEKSYEKALESCKYLEKTIDMDKGLDYKKFVECMIVIYPFSSLGNLAGKWENIDEELRSLLIEFRNRYDYILYKADEYLLKKANQLLREEYVPYVNFLSINEIFENKLPPIRVLKKRSEGFIYFDGQLEMTTDVGKWLLQNNFRIDEEEKSSADIKGNVAYGGCVEGRVCLVFTKEDFAKFEEGDILITPMTTPKFTSIIKKARAIVTDEGGVTCHAAIVARELKVPCLVGCRKATVLLKDGMFVRIDADAGTVSIL